MRAFPLPLLFTSHCPTPPPGIDPGNPELPKFARPDGAADGAAASLPATPRDAAAASKTKPKTGRGGRDAPAGGGKLSKVAAAKEKAKEKAAAAAASAAAPARGARPSAAPGKLQLPAAMLAAAAAADGEGGGGGGGGGGIAIAAGMWRANAGGGYGSGPIPVYIRPDRAAANARLQEALNKYADAKPRTLEVRGGTRFRQAGGHTSFCVSLACFACLMATLYGNSSTVRRAAGGQHPTTDAECAPALLLLPFPAVAAQADHVIDPVYHGKITSTTIARNII